MAIAGGPIDAEQAGRQYQQTEKNAERQQQKRAPRRRIGTSPLYQVICVDLCHELRQLAIDLTPECRIALAERRGPAYSRQLPAANALSEVRDDGFGHRDPLL